MPGWDANAYTLGHTDSEPNSNAIGNAVSHAKCNPNSYTDSDCHRDNDPYSYSYA